MMIISKTLSPDEMKTVYPKILEGFDEKEVRPFHNIKQLYEKNIYKGYGYYEDNEQIGIAFVYGLKDNYMLDYLYIFPEYQDKGYGSSLLRLILDLYKDKKLFIEVETAKSDIQLKRMAFYYKNGLINTNLKEILFDVEYDILANDNTKDMNLKKALYELYKETVEIDLLSRNLRFL